MAKTIFILLLTSYSNILCAQNRTCIETLEIGKLIMDMQKADLLPDTISIVSKPYNFKNEELDTIFFYSASNNQNKKYISKQLNCNPDFNWAGISVSNATIISDSLLIVRHLSSKDSMNNLDSPPWDIYFELSKPLFSHNKKLAFIRVRYFLHQCNIPCGEGWLYILRKVNDKWTFHKGVDFWSSD